MASSTSPSTARRSPVRGWVAGGKRLHPPLVDDVARRARGCSPVDAHEHALELYPCRPSCLDWCRARCWRPQPRGVLQLRTAGENGRHTRLLSPCGEHAPSLAANRVAAQGLDRSTRPATGCRGSARPAPPRPQDQQKVAAGTPVGRLVGLPTTGNRHSEQLSRQHHRGPAPSPAPCRHRRPIEDETRAEKGSDELAGSPGSSGRHPSAADRAPGRHGSRPPCIRRTGACPPPQDRRRRDDPPSGDGAPELVAVDRVGPAACGAHPSPGRRRRRPAAGRGAGRADHRSGVAAGSAWCAPHAGAHPCCVTGSDPGCAARMT